MHLLFLENPFWIIWQSLSILTNLNNLMVQGPEAPLSPTLQNLPISGRVEYGITLQYAFAQPCLSRISKCTGWVLREIGWWPD